ncbi:MAG: ChbG/HpnK family deacetylase [Syntrophorhabdaceae bacterium]|nr:ChbG/HpnK family deacetylase [Syntrophorhabdaceae bacterium]
MKRVIINADDLGADVPRNEGILEAIRAGTVTSVSILANGPALEDALQRIRPLDHSKVSFGIHCNISEGTPLAGGLRILAGPDGCFMKKAAAHQLLMRGGAAVEEEIARELDMQIEALKGAGLRLTHIDGHHHVHVFPAAIKAVCAAARKHGIPWMRIPDEPEPVSREDGIPGSLLEESKAFSGLAGHARLYIEGTGLKAPDHFRGLYLKGRASLQSMQKTLEELKPGLTEIMMHPGRAVAGRPQGGPFSSFSTMDRERELHVLLSEEFRLALLRIGVILIPFPEVKG